MKSEPHTSEYGNFESALRTVLSVPHSEIKRILDTEKQNKAKKKKQQTKTSRASRASRDKG
jgi:hypothetical protein